ncbi:MAG: nucleotidyltransferase domain-containing protein [Spiribacter salinus]|uniref:Nucleotidyltransferase domain-containing protein n=1 Tax=Spiribacter salinus TaxID=1335746 RepID=A0A540VP59_9GAMM|nr:MAG: nucleotidyltransferase domain-containing protein [Spiribacter salinus]
MLTPHQKNQLRDLAQQYGWRLLVLFGSVARGEDGGDVDLGIMPAASPGVMTQARWQRELEAIVDPKPVDMVILYPGTSPLTRFQVLWNGLCLFEARQGVFEHEQNRAFFLQADAQLWEQHQAEVSDG